MASSKPLSAERYVCKEECWVPQSLGCSQASAMQNCGKEKVGLFQREHTSDQFRDAAPSLSVGLLFAPAPPQPLPSSPSALVPSLTVIPAPCSSLTVPLTWEVLEAGQAWIPDFSPAQSPRLKKATISKYTSREEGEGIRLLWSREEVWPSTPKSRGQISCQTRWGKAAGHLWDWWGGYTILTGVECVRGEKQGFYQTLCSLGITQQC